MLFNSLLLLVQYLSSLLLIVNGENLEKLPYCVENSVPGLVLVSTIDGKFSAINSEGSLVWQIETGPGSLLTSNIHNLELTNNGQWIRIIPSLLGSLYRFDGSTIDPIPITAESLLKSSFKYSDDLVIAGGLEVRTYGVGFRTGKVFYVCTPTKCTNNTENENLDDILLVERSTQIVRAVETQSGHEKWNFSVGYHNIRLPQISCLSQTSNFNWNISAIIPDGLIIASNLENNVEITWQYHFNSPIVRVWKWNGFKLSEVDLFNINNYEPTESQIFPAIYIGMHKKQLYIHESHSFHFTTVPKMAIEEARSVLKIPWKPISASGLLTEDDSTALSVLYSSEYVNGQGYYLFSENDIKRKNSGLCEKNNTIKIKKILLEKDSEYYLPTLLKLWWKELLLLTISFAFMFHYIFSFLINNEPTREIIFVERKSETPEPDKITETIFPTSRFINDFDTLRCLGKGGFGIVFEVKQKIDECHYAIKRIILPNEESKRDTVMREVKALAKLEHNNIVRYFNSWVESPPLNWHQEHDQKWIEEDWSTNFFNNYSVSLNDTKSNKIDTVKNNDDSFIVFKNSSNNNINEAVINNDSVSKKDSKINWRRPSRRHHSLDKNLDVKPPVFLYIQMQLCQKQSLKDWLEGTSNRDPTYVLHIFKQIVSAVEYVHLQGLIHRDLKPSNIFFSLDGQIKVGDFGLVKDVEECFDITPNITPTRGHTKEVGTKLYMSPEQRNGTKYDYKVDIYSLGLIFFELLMHFRTDMERIQTLSNVRDNRYPHDFVDKFPEEYDLLVMMLCKYPDKRPTTFGIRARPPISDNNSNLFHFELPKAKRQ